MRIKTVETVLATNTAGQVVESLPVREVEDAVQNAAGQWVDPIDVEEADDGVPVRFVETAVTTNSVGQPVAATPVRGVLPALPEGYAFVVDYQGRYCVDHDGNFYIARVL